MTPEDHIQVKCDHCNHIIKAPRKAAGKRGKCPHCQNSVYVPTPEDELDEIPLAPVDESADERARRLEREAFEVASALRREAASPDDKEPAAAPEAAAARGPATPAVDVGDAIVEYLRAMQASDLPGAERAARELKAVARAAKSKIQQMMVDSMPPAAVRNMPSGLYQGFLRKLLEQLG